MEKSREEMKVKTQVQSLVDEYDLQSKKTKQKTRGKSPYLQQKPKVAKEGINQKKGLGYNLGPSCKDNIGGRNVGQVIQLEGDMYVK